MILKDMETFDGPDVVDDVTDPFQKLMGVRDEGVAFALFGADGHEAHAWGLDPEHHPAVVAAKDGVVHQMIGAGFRVRTGVNEDKVSTLAGNHRGKSRSVNAFHRPEPEGAGSHK